MSSEGQARAVLRGGQGLRQSRCEAADLIQQVGAVDAGREAFTGFYAKHGLQVIAHTLGCSCGQGHDRHVRKLLLQHSQFLVVRPALGMNPFARQ